MWAREPVWHWISIERVPTQDLGVVGLNEPVRSWLRGFTFINRWTGEEVGGVAYYLDGFKYKEWRGDPVLGYEWTVWNRPRWNSHGHVAAQCRPGKTGLFENKSSPPWWWGVTDQAAPSMPAWMKDDEKWAKALEEQGR